MLKIGVGIEPNCDLKIDVTPNPAHLSIHDVYRAKCCISTRIWQDFEAVIVGST